MERLPTEQLMLEMIQRPAFCVRDDAIIYANEAARQMQILPGGSIFDYLLNDLETYYKSDSDNLSLTVHVLGRKCIASVIRTNDYDVFRLEQMPSIPELRMFNLAAMQMRLPLTSALAICDDILDVEENKQNPKIAHISKALYQLHRVVCNISDTGRYWETGFDELEGVNITAVINEIMEKAISTLQGSNVHILYYGPNENILTMANEEMLTRAIYNMLSNAVKYSPTGSIIEVRFARHENMLHFSVQDEGDGIPKDVLANVYSRFMRNPGAEDGRTGIGLGLPLIQAAASAHKGTVFIDRPEGHGTRVTMTMQYIPAQGNTLRSPVRSISNYAGGRDIALLELSDVLSPSAYLTD